MTRRSLTVASSAAVLALGVALEWPVTTRQGIDYHVSAHRIPLYRKASEFVSRSAKYQQIAEEIVKGRSSDEERAMAVFDWTVRRVGPVPEGVPVVDDHISNVIARGYGTGDQRADVFATLTVYAGVPAFWAKVPKGLAAPGVILTFVKLEDRWRVFDAAAGIAYRSDSGALATLQDLSARPDLVPAEVRDLEIEPGMSYGATLTRAPMPLVPRPLRAELQMPTLRVWHEVKAAVGIESVGEPQR